jgi:hypothetical protein
MKKLISWDKYSKEELEAIKKKTKSSKTEEKQKK